VDVKRIFTIDYVNRKFMRSVAELAIDMRDDEISVAEGKTKKLKNY
jgi:hypothetical protein